MVEQYLIKWSKCSALSWLNIVAWESSPPLYFDLVTLTLLITTLPIHLVTITSIKIWRTTLFLELIHLCSLIITKPSVVLFYFCWWGNIEFSENVISCEVSYVWYHWLIRFQVLYVMQWWGACAWCLCWSLFCSVQTMRWEELGLVTDQSAATATWEYHWIQGGIQN